MIAIIASMLLHALALFVLYRHHVLDFKTPVTAASEPLNIRLVPLKAQVRQAPTRARTHVRVPRSEKVIALDKPLSRESVKRAPAPKPQAVPPMSFLDYVNAERARRGAASNEYANATPSTEVVGPSPDGGRSKPQGTNGIFQILRMDDRSAEFSFLGWHSEYSNSHKEVFDVEAGPEGDIRHAIVHKMIEIIRRYYKGDFNWDSQRLGGVVVLSARIQDTQALETFMMKEFFGPA